MRTLFITLLVLLGLACERTPEERFPLNRTQTLRTDVDVVLSDGRTFTTNATVYFQYTNPRKADVLGKEAMDDDIRVWTRHAVAGQYRLAGPVPPVAMNPTFRRQIGVAATKFMDSEFLITDLPAQVLYVALDDERVTPADIEAIQPELAAHRLEKAPQIAEARLRLMLSHVQYENDNAYYDSTLAMMMILML